jgi:hypothetical protein
MEQIGHISVTTVLGSFAISSINSRLGFILTSYVLKEKTGG